jgi:hypothetical protein
VNKRYNKGVLATARKEPGMIAPGLDTGELRVLFGRGLRQQRRLFFWVPSRPTSVGWRGGCSPWLTGLLYECVDLSPFWKFGDEVFYICIFGIGAAGSHTAVPVSFGLSPTFSNTHPPSLGQSLCTLPNGLNLLLFIVILTHARPLRRWISVSAAARDRDAGYAVDSGRLFSRFR